METHKRSRRHLAGSKGQKNKKLTGSQEEGVGSNNLKSLTTLEITALEDEAISEESENNEEVLIVYEGTIEGRSGRVLIDSGSNANFISSKFVEKRLLPVRKAGMLNYRRNGKLSIQAPTVNEHPDKFSTASDRQCWV